LVQEKTHLRRLFFAFLLTRKKKVTMILFRNIPSECAHLYLPLSRHYFSGANALDLPLPVLVLLRSPAL
jgi:hypothetical protein